MRKLLIVLLAALLFAFAGCTNSTSGMPDAQPAQGGGAPAKVGDVTSGNEGAPMDVNNPTAKLPADVTDQSGRLVIRNATTSLWVDDVPAALQKVKAMVGALTGVVSAEDTQRYGDAITSTLTLSVPSDKLDATLTQLAQIGQVNKQTINSTDVTGEVVDLVARVKSAQASVDRIRAMFDKATTVSDLVKVEQELATRQAELESLTARKQALEASVAMSSIVLTLSVKTDPNPSPIVDGLETGWKAFLGSLVTLLTVLAAALPWLVLIAAIGTPFLLRWRKRPRPSAPTAPTTDQSTDQSTDQPMTSSTDEPAS